MSASEIHDYSTAGKKAIVRVIRPHHHIGHSYGGDRVRIDADELKAPAVAAALWTEEEAKAAALALEQRRAAMFRDEPTGAMRAADAQLSAAVSQRAREAEEARKAPAEK